MARASNVPVRPSRAVKMVKLFREITAWREVGVHSAGKGGGAAHICGGGVRWIDLHDIKRAGLEREIAASDRHRAGCSCRTGSEAAAGVDDSRAHGAAAPQRGAAAHGGQARRRDRAIHDQRASIHRRRPDQHHLQLVEADMAGVGLTPCRSMAAENIGDLQGRTRHAAAL